MRHYTAWAVLLLVAVSAGAETLIPADCLNFPGDKTACEAVLNEPDLSLNDKKDLFAELWIQNTLMPNHDAIYDWDNDIAVGGPPQGTNVYSGSVIKSAWVRLLYVLPAVYDKDEGKWYLPPVVSARAHYDYYVDLPSGTEPGDCQTSYGIANEDVDVVFRRNGTSVGQGNAANISTVAGVNSIEAVANIGVVLQVTHYSEVTTCIAHDPNTGACTQTATSCQSTGSEFRDYSAGVSDLFTGTRRDFGHNVEFQYEDLNGLRQATIDLSTTGPMNEFVLDFDGAKYSVSESRYGVKRRLFPYDYLYIERTQKLTKEKAGLVELEFKRTVAGNQYVYHIVLGLDKKPQACSMKILSDFAEYDESDQCVFLDLTPTRLTLALDKQDYDFEEPMKATANLSTTAGVPVQGRTIVLSYGEKTAQGLTDSDGNVSFSLVAKESFGAVHAAFRTDSVYSSAKGVARAVLRTKADWDLIVIVAGYLIINILVFLLLQKYLGKWMD